MSKYRIKHFKYGDLLEFWEVQKFVWWMFGYCRIASFDTYERAYHYYMVQKTWKA